MRKPLLLGGPHRRRGDRVLLGQPFPQTELDVGVGGIARQVAPFTGVGPVVVEFLVAVGIADVAPLLIANRVVVAQIRHDRRLLPRGRGIAEQGNDATAVHGVRRPQRAKLQQCRIQARQVYRARAPSAGCRRPGSDHDERDVGGLLPEGEFLPVILFTEVVAVVRPEDDDGAVSGAGGIEGVNTAGVKNGKSDPVSGPWGGGPPQCHPDW